jgi:hypothetical protein
LAAAIGSGGFGATADADAALEAAGLPSTALENVLEAVRSEAEALSALVSWGS